MAVTPRKEEVARVVELLEDEHESAEALAKVLIKEIMGPMAQAREWYVAVHKPYPDTDRAHWTWLFGPVSQEREAVKLLKENCHGGTGAVYPVKSVAGLLARPE